VLGLSGGILGVLFSNPMLNGFGKAMNQFGFLSGLGFSTTTGVLALGFSTVIGLVAAALPAFSTSRMDVVEALRRQE
jgi:ABC-type antimicrobial peptide transport system permease subunit